MGFERTVTGLIAVKDRWQAREGKVDVTGETKSRRGLIWYGFSEKFMGLNQCNRFVHCKT